MGERYDPYCDEDILKLLDDTSDIGSDWDDDDLDADKTYQPSKEDLRSESDDSDDGIMFVRNPSEIQKAVSITFTSTVNKKDLSKPSTSKEVSLNNEYNLSLQAQTPSDNSQRLGDEDKRNGDQNGVAVKNKETLKKKNSLKKVSLKSTVIKSRQKTAKKGKAPKKIWKKGKFTSKTFPGPFDPADIQNPEPVKLPSEYFMQYFSDEFYEQAALYTNMYSVKTTGRSAKTTSRELKTFVALNIVMGCFPYPRLRMYWKRGYMLPCVGDFMSRDRFLMLRNIFHLVDTETPPVNRDNRLWKVQPIIDVVKNVCLNLPRDYKTYSIDEQMIPFTGRCPLRQYVKNKPRPVGLKVFVVTTSSGLVLDFEVYQGQSTPLLNTELGLGPAVVMTLVKTIPAESFVFFDRYFTSIPLLEKLESMGIEGSGTIMGNRIGAIHIESEEEITFKRGDCTEYLSENKKLVLVQWQDTKKVLMASTCFGATPTATVKRWSKTDNQFIDVPCPPVIRNYNKCMGGVDVFNQLMEYYRSFFKTRKWTWKVIVHFIDFAVVNSHMLYVRDAKANKVPKKNCHDLLSFRLAIYEWLLHANKTNRNSAPTDGPEETDEPPIRRSKFYNPPAKMPVADKRLDGFEHWPVVDDIAAPRACRLDGCTSRSKVMCEKCKTYLCLSKQKNCFKLFHSKK